ncbi:unnamed protein product [Colias eurytheme]|nr:unnamed protein product [Colias eurytheme]
MPKVVLKYLTLKALGEPIRLLLTYVGQEFEDERWTYEQLYGRRDLIPFGQLPVLEIDGKQYAQSLAIGRYLGRKYGLVGDNLEQDFEIDQNVDFLYDIRGRAATVHYEQDPEIKARKHAENTKNWYPVLLKKLDDIIKENNGHLAAGKLTWVDFVFAGMFDHLRVMLQMPDLGQQYPRFQQLVDSIYTIPQIKAFSDKAPKCIM